MGIYRRFFSVAASLIGAITLTACTSTTEPQSYLSRGYEDIENTPEVTQLLLKKEDRKLYLFHENEVVRAYDVDLGFSPEGHKTQQGDGRTPEGLYHINRRNPQSKFHRSIGISYPNANDLAQARRRGVSPGGDIFIHGEAKWASQSGTDWTAGCIALPDDLMNEIWALVDIGTPIMITQ